MSDLKFKDTTSAIRRMDRRSTVSLKKDLRTKEINMLRPTHKRAGFLTGLVSSITFLSTIDQINSLGTVLHVMLAILLIIAGNYLGAEWPDIDSKSSIPRKEHPIWGHIFDALGIRHRGPISHSVLSITLIWFLPALLIKFFGPDLIMNSSDDAKKMFLALINLILSFSLARIISILVSSIRPLFTAKDKTPDGFLNSLLFLMTDDRMFSKKAGIRRMKEQKVREVCFIALFISIAFFFIIDPVTDVKTSNVTSAISLMFIYVVAIYIGCLSHLWMDVSTLDGVYIDWSHKVSPAKWMMKTPGLNLFVPNNQFRTGSSWETVVRIIISIVNMIAFVYLIYVLIMKF